MIIILLVNSQCLLMLVKENIIAGQCYLKLLQVTVTVNVEIFVLYIFLRFCNISEKYVYRENNFYYAIYRQ